ncbi:NAD-dependent protein deacetylase [Halobacillus andaensis]|uniref:protein acetyllysine N-acetyltransferase n=1 Tax=Halobacillus andaensis TaxID=1176239 RepID=A0A917B1S1_HALAA|nr:NAD-dependent protein deacylase [Halobacillus andaensis]MBP2003715.1 NAD-dependent deacetylase [Halobacillus andaensis]GGF12658.1 NAD-dependent protein deacetylase [Halobacillus andaensis]
MKNQLKQTAEQLAQARHVVVLTGAGVSTASGIPDFRSNEGLWAQDFKREDYMSVDYYNFDPVDFWIKYKEIFRLKLLQQYEPNVVHHFLKQLETKGRRISIITQNVDGLHAQVNSSRVVEYHGSLNKATCPHCQEAYTMEYVLANDTPQCKECNTVLKPNVVLFGDLITAHDEAEALIDEADFLLVLGTSLQVTPFSFLPEYASSRNIASTLINKEATIKDRVFDQVILGDLSELIPKLQTELKNVSSF